MCEEKSTLESANLLDEGRIKRVVTYSLAVFMDHRLEGIDTEKYHILKILSPSLSKIIYFVNI